MRFYVFCHRCTALEHEIKAKVAGDSKFIKRLIQNRALKRYGSLIIKGVDFKGFQKLVIKGISAEKQFYLQSMYTFGFTRDFTRGFTPSR